MNSYQNDPGSITQALTRLGANDEEAAYLLWSRFFRRLSQFAESRIFPQHRRLVSPDDIASQALMALVEGCREEKFSKVRNRDDLWQLLTLIAARRVINEQTCRQRQKRGNGRVATECDLNGTEVGQLTEFVRRDLSPEQFVQLKELLEELMLALPNEKLQAVAQARLGGFSAQEIASQLGCATRTVDRKLELIREIWRARLP